MMRTTLTLAGVLCGLVLVSSCKVQQPQLLVVIDTDLVLPRQLARDPALPRAASFEQLQIDMLNAEGEGLQANEILQSTLLTELRRTIVIGEDTTWPLTFGVRATATGERSVRMRIRAFRSDSILLASESTTSSDGAPLVFDEQLTLVRVVELTVPAEGVETVRVVLAGDCIGIPDIPAELRTCITGPEDIRGASEGIERVGGAIPQTIAGSWGPAQPAPCTSTSPPGADAVCVPGSVYVRGDKTFEENIDEYIASFPRHMVHITPFFLDRREVTVRRFRGFVDRGGHGALSLPRPTSPANPLCTWTAEPGELEDHPINCLTKSLATAFCRAEGGDLPTDGQWELAARGRGNGPFVWGAQAASCCSSRIAASLGCGTTEGPVRVGSFIDGDGCGRTSDVSADGVLDLVGNVRELVRDSWVYYGASECPREAIARDPLCVVDRGFDLARGGSFRSSFDRAKIGARSRAEVADDLGFRCAYRGAP